MSQVPDLSDPVFGTLVYNDALSTFEVRADWLGQSIRVSFVIENIDPIAGLKKAYGIWRQGNALAARVRAAITAELIPLKNESWLSEGEAEVTEAELLARLSLEDIHFLIDDGGAGFEFIYGDDELFGGHAVIVGGDSDEEDLDVSLFG